MLMESSSDTRPAIVPQQRIDAVASTSTGHRERRQQLHDLLRLAQRGLAAMYEPEPGGFPQTMRGLPSTTGPRLEAEGDNFRYAAMVALGVSRLLEHDQKHVLQGSTAAQLARSVVARTSASGELGSVALATWALAEVAGEVDSSLISSLDRLADGQAPVDTVVWSWALTAAVAAGHLVDTASLADRLARGLLAAQGNHGIFPHVLPADSQGRFRAHVGCYADQVYPIQALARYAARTGHEEALGAANRCARRLCLLQGAAGEWWWHYDVRDGSVVERYPVYSVHQHAMGPMALLDLLEAGGEDHRAEVALGVNWLSSHPQVMDELVSPQLSVVWRKVGRREPAKASRVAAAVVSSVRPGLRPKGLDSIWPPVVIDHECRPYELGWLLYAWRGAGVVDTIAARGRDRA